MSAVTGAAEATKPTSWARRRRTREAALGYALVLPALVVFGVFTFYPFARTIWLGFYRTPPFPGLPRTYAGTEQYADVLSGADFLNSLKVTLLYVGPSHRDNAIHVHVPAEGVLISIDTARNSLYPDLRDFDVHPGIAGYRRLAKLDDVDIVLPGHGPTLLRQDNFTRMADFLQTLHDRVLEEMIAGHPLPEIRKRVKMDEFRDLGGIDTALDTNIVTMYDYLYRYREPNSPLSGAEAVSCIENSSACRTSD